MSNTITLTFDAPRRQTFKLPLFTRDKTNTFYYCVLSDDCVIVVDSGRIEISDVPKQALRQGYVEIDEYEFRDRYDKALTRLIACLHTIDEMKKAIEIIDSNQQLRHQ